MEKKCDKVNFKTLITIPESFYKSLLTTVQMLISITKLT